VGGPASHTIKLNALTGVGGRALSADAQPSSRPGPRCSVTAGAPGTDVAIEQIESTPTETCFRCTLATIEHRSPQVFNSVAEQTLGAVATVIVTVSALSDDRWGVVLDQAFEQGLPSITNFAMPYDVAFQSATRNSGLHLALDELRPLSSDDAACPKAGPGLDFSETPGPGTACRTATTSCGSSTRTSPDGCGQPWRPSGKHRPSPTQSRPYANAAGSTGTSSWPSTESRRTPG
jgi:hypothetical protein